MTNDCTHNAIQVLSWLIFETLHTQTPFANYCVCHCHAVLSYKINTAVTVVRTQHGVWEWLSQSHSHIPMIVQVGEVNALGSATHIHLNFEF